MSVTLIVGDPHIGKGISIGKPGIGGVVNSRVSDQTSILDWILEQAITNNATTIILTGDVFEDVKPDYRLMVLFLNWLKKCENYGIDIDIVGGNHDIKRSGSHYTSALDIIHSAGISNTAVYKQVCTIFNGTVGFTLFPFRDRRSFNTDSATEALEKIQDILAFEKASIPNSYDKVVIGHLAIEGSIIVGDEFDDTANELMCPVSMFNGYDYVWMGHVHKPQVRNKSNPYVAHIGSMDLSDFGETDHTKIIVIYDSQSPNKFKEIPIPSRPLRRLRISVPSGSDTTELVVNSLMDLDKKSSLKNSIIKIEAQLLGADVPNADRSKVEQEVYKLGVFHLSNFSESRNISVVPIEKRAELDLTINPKTAAKMFCEQVLKLEGDEMSQFLIYCNDVIDEYQEIKNDR